MGPCPAPDATLIDVLPFTVSCGSPSMSTWFGALGQQGNAARPATLRRNVRSPTDPGPLRESSVAGARKMPSRQSVTLRIADRAPGRPAAPSNKRVILAHLLPSRRTASSARVESCHAVLAKSREFQVTSGLSCSRSTSSKAHSFLP